MSSIGCTVPLLIGLTLAASTEFGTFIGSMTVFVIYALSAAMMMIGAILLIAASKRVLVDWMRRNMERIKQVSGGVLIFVGIWVMIWFIEYQFLIKILPF
jgi:cytochrome c biogenesis protein CcdA